MVEQGLKRYIPLAARSFLALVFLRSGVTKILGFTGTQDFMASSGIPEALTGVLLVLAIVAELVGAISMILGYKARWGAIALILFLIPATLIFHLDFSDNGQTIQFFKNLSIMGGLLMVYAYGSGPVSLDSSHRPQSSISNE